MNHDRKNQEHIKIIGARENNLKNINLSIPKENLVVIAGLSGSGKSSIAFDTIAAESGRQWQASYPAFIRQRLPRYERPDVEAIHNLTPAIVVDQKPFGSNARSTVGTISDIAPLVRLLFSRIGQPSAGGSMAYSFNHPHGMCPVCTGLGRKISLDESKMFDMSKSINEGAIQFSQFFGGSWQDFYYTHNPLFSADKKLKDFTLEEWEALHTGPKDQLYMDHVWPNTGQVAHLPYEGIVPRFQRLYLNRDISSLKNSVKEEVMGLIHEAPCSACGGSGLNPAALESKINGHNISDYYDMQVDELITILKEITDPLGSSIAGQIMTSLTSMVDVGLGYLSLARKTDTLSGGEAQRLKMVRHLNSSLSNITYIFDEPTAGLHPKDAGKIGQLLMDFRDNRNTVLVVEHSQQIMEMADHIIEVGPAAGEQGGEIIFQGTYEELKNAQTATALSLRENIKINRSPRSFQESYPLEDVNLHNLKNLSTRIPKGVYTAVTGVAGSGKSSLICGAFASRYKEALVIDQKQIGVSSRSTPATYVGVMNQIRSLFSKENGVSSKWFSFNSDGACPVCKGKGEVLPDVAFADPVAIVCEECGGHRFNKTALSYQFRGKNIEEVMNMTILEAMEFFPQANIRKKLHQMLDVGLEYMTLGQSTNTLSGGELQRLKLSSELDTKGNIYILDEPSTGLHSKDVMKLKKLFRRLVDKGNTVIAVEHRMELIAEADWVIDLGPGPGKDGGQIIFEGVPEELIHCNESETGKYLRRFS